MSINNFANRFVLNKYSIKDLKTEAVLVAASRLFGLYLESVNEGNVTYTLDEEESKKHEEFIINEVKIIKKYLNENVHSVEMLEAILENANKSIYHKRIAQSIEPIAFFYNFINKQFNSRYNTYNANMEKKTWKPEMLAFYLIYDLKEANYSFEKFDFIEHYDFARIFSKYAELNKKLKIKNNIVGFDKELRLVTTKTQAVSNGTITSLIEKKYYSGTKTDGSKKQKRKKR